MPLSEEKNVGIPWVWGVRISPWAQERKPTGGLSWIPWARGVKNLPEAQERWLIGGLSCILWVWGSKNLVSDPRESTKEDESLSFGKGWLSAQKERKEKNDDKHEWIQCIKRNRWDNSFRWSGE